MTSLPEMEQAGWATALGLDGMRLLESRDPVERAAMVAHIDQALKARILLDDALAVRLGGTPLE